jgi:hypothetical protein
MFEVSRKSKNTCLNLKCMTQVKITQVFYKLAQISPCKDEAVNPPHIASP